MRGVDHPVSIAAAICVMVLGSLNFPLMPMVVGAMTDHLAFSTREIGIVASADMFGMFLSALCALYWIRRVNFRWAAMSFCLCLVLANVVSSLLTSFSELALVRLLAGFCGGSMMAIGSTLVSDTSTPERNFALLTAAQMATAALGFLVLPGIITARGTQGVFLFLATIVTPALVASTLIPTFGAWQQSAADPSGIRSSRGKAIAIAVLVTLPGFLFHLGYGASWTYIERLGVSSGMSPDSVGRALSASFLAGVMGSLLAWWLGLRWGRFVPFAVTISVQLVSLGVLAFVMDTVTGFVAALMAYAFFLNFPIPYQIGLAVTLDRTGRAAVLYLLMLKAGIAIAPLFASSFVTAQDYTIPLVIAAICYSACFLNLAMLLRAFAARLRAP